jgi:hypothetical protein
MIKIHFGRKMLFYSSDSQLRILILAKPTCCIIHEADDRFEQEACNLLFREAREIEAVLAYMSNVLSRMIYMVKLPYSQR